MKQTQWEKDVNTVLIGFMILWLVTGGLTVLALYWIHS